MTEQDQMRLLRQKLRLTMEALNNCEQAYHLLAQTIGKGERHWSSDWKNCSEQSCTAAKSFLDKLEAIKVE